MLNTIKAESPYVHPEPLTLRTHKYKILEFATRDQALAAAKSAVMNWRGPDLGLQVAEPATLDPDKAMFNDRPYSSAVLQQGHVFSPRLSTSSGDYCLLAWGADLAVAGLFFHKRNQLHPDFAGLIWISDLSGRVMAEMGRGPIIG